MGTDPQIEGKTIVLFDGVCNLCNGAVNFIIDRDPGARLYFASLQSNFGQKVIIDHHLDSEQLETMVLMENGSMYYRSEAALRISRKLNGVWPVFGILLIIPRFIRDAMYNLVARNRYKWFGKRDQCRLPTKELQSRFLDS